MPEAKQPEAEAKQPEAEAKPGKKNVFIEKDGGKTLVVKGDINVVGAAGVELSKYERVELSNGLVITRSV
jgi:hypothetical protein